MELSPRLYHWLIRPNWAIRPFINKTFDKLLHGIDFRHKDILDFGCGVGSICFKFDPEHYVGVDYDHRRIRYAQCLNRNYQFLNFNGSTIDLQNQSLDYVLIMAVLHHIPSSQLNEYFHEFHRLLRVDGKIIVIEPCFLEGSRYRNWYMKTFDKGKYIRNQEEYMELFYRNYYRIEAVNTFCKNFVYNEIFFVASQHH
jgi:SAM-dependent methyltransferase